MSNPISYFSPCALTYASVDLVLCVPTSPPPSSVTLPVPLSTSCCVSQPHLCHPLLPYLCLCHPPAVCPNLTSSILEARSSVMVRTSLLYILLALAAAALPGARAADPVFPLLPQTFSMYEAFWQPAGATGPPTATRNMTWDTGARRAMFYALEPNSMFSLQIQRCDLAVTELINVRGDPTADPSTYKCTIQKNVPADFCPPPPAPFHQFWAKPPKTYTFNGTDIINGATCNRFDFSLGMGAQSFWATPTAPCRANHPGQREDYLDFDATPPPASAFDVRREPDERERRRMGTYGESQMCIE